MDVLKSPALQGVGAVAAVVAVVLYVWFEGRRKAAKEENDRRYRIFTISTPEGEREFYRALSSSIRDATDAIYRSGRGFTSERLRSRIHDLVGAEEVALRNGVRVTRIQTGTQANQEWAESYARLMDQFPDKLKVVQDFTEPSLVNVALIDPYGTNPIIQLLFEAEEPRPQGARHRGASAIFLYGEPALSASLAAQFATRAGALAPMSSDDIRDLARSYVYFAYGSNMSKEQMRERCPQAEDLGRAILYGWTRVFAVEAAHMGGTCAAGIKPADASEYVEGVAYALTGADKQRLDAIEYGGYVPTSVSIKAAGQHRSAFTHIPLKLREGDVSISPDYLETLIKGAIEHRFSDTTVATLRGLQSQLERD